MSNETTKPNVRKFRMFAEPMHKAIGKLTQPVLKKQGLEAGLLEHWDNIVGSDLAAFCQPVKLSIAKGKQSGVLTVEVLTSHALLAQHMQSIIIEKLTIYHGCRAVERIVFKQRSTPFKAFETPAEISSDRLIMAEKLRQLRESLTL
jgi:hypothetical protein